MQYTNGNPGKVSRNVSIGTDRSLGATYTELANKYSLSPKHIGRILNDSEIRDVVETGTRHMVSYLPIALSRFYDVLQDPTNSDHYKAIKDNLQATGILPAHASSVTINSIVYQDNRSAISPEIQQIMTHQLDQQTVEDGEFEVLDED